MAVTTLPWSAEWGVWLLEDNDGADGVFDLSDRYASLDAKRDPLIAINAHALGGVSPDAGAQNWMSPWLK
jgi:hypothetical protein